MEGKTVAIFFSTFDYKRSPLFIKSSSFVYCGAHNLLVFRHYLVYKKNTIHNNNDNLGECFKSFKSKNCVVFLKFHCISMATKITKYDSL